MYSRVPTSGAFFLRLEIGHLSADHSTIRARSLRNRRQDIQAALRFHWHESQRLKCQR